MLEVLNHPTKSLYYRGCNLQKSCNVLSEETQKHFNLTFEASCAPSDFGNLGTFRGDMMCKVKSNQGKVRRGASSHPRLLFQIALIYANPHQYTLEGASRPLTESEIAGKHWSAAELVETSF